MTKSKKHVSTSELRRELVALYRSMSAEQRLRMSRELDRELLRSRRAVPQ